MCAHLVREVIVCDCDPGSSANGWQETRGPRCAAADNAAWAEFFARVPEIVSDLRVGLAAKTITRPITVQEPPAEGDWQIDQQEAGDDG